MSQDEEMRQAMQRVSQQAATAYMAWCRECARLMNVTVGLVASDQNFLDAWDRGMTPENAVSFIIGH